MAHKAPTNFEFIEMNDLSTKEIKKRGYTVKGITLRCHQNSMYGFVNGKTHNFKDYIDVPKSIATKKNGKPQTIPIKNQNSWGFDECYFELSGKANCLEKLVNFINNETLKMVEELRKNVRNIFNLDIPADAEFRQLEIFVSRLFLEFDETGEQLFWQRKMLPSKVKKEGMIPGLVLITIDGKEISSDTDGLDENKIYETDLWRVGKAFTDENDDFCLLGNRNKLVPVCG